VVARRPSRSSAAGQSCAAATAAVRLLVETQGMSRLMSARKADATEVDRQAGRQQA
jgi:hypothetical protein